jgi:hypothetical protein
MRFRRMAFCAWLGVVFGVLVMAYGALSAKAYTGAGGCGGPIPPHTTRACAYHTNFRRIVAYANQSHWVDSNGGQYAVSAGCSGNCTADTGYAKHPLNAAPTIQNTSNYTITALSVYIYQ